MKNLNPLVVLEADWRQRLIDDGTFERLNQKVGSASAGPLTPRERWLWNKLNAKYYGKKAGKYLERQEPLPWKLMKSQGNHSKNIATGEMIFNIEKEPKRAIDRIISAKSRNGSEYIYKNKDVADVARKMLNADRVKQGKPVVKKSISDKVKSFAKDMQKEMRKASSKSLGKKGKIGLAVAGGLGLGGLGLYAASKRKDKNKGK